MNGTLHKQREKMILRWTAGIYGGLILLSPLFLKFTLRDALHAYEVALMIRLGGLVLAFLLFFTVRLLMAFYRKFISFGLYPWLTTRPGFPILILLPAPGFVVLGLFGTHVSGEVKDYFLFLIIAVFYLIRFSLALYQLFDEEEGRR